MSRKTLDLLPLATRSLQSVFDVVDHVNPALRPEATQAVKSLFDLLAWSDGRMDPEEAALLERLCAEVAAFGEHCTDVQAYDPVDPMLPETPALLGAIVQHDRRSGERLAPVLISCLETIGHAVIGAGGVSIDIEKSELYTYIDSLRRVSRLLTTAATVGSGS